MGILTCWCRWGAYKGFLNSKTCNGTRCTIIDDSRERKGTQELENGESLKVVLHWSICNANLQRRSQSMFFARICRHVTLAASFWIAFKTLHNALQHCKYRKKSSATGCYTERFFAQHRIIASWRCKLTSVTPPPEIPARDSTDYNWIRGQCYKAKQSTVLILNLFNGYHSTTVLLVPSPLHTKASFTQPLDIWEIRTATATWGIKKNLSQISLFLPWFYCFHHLSLQKSDCCTDVHVLTTEKQTALEVACVRTETSRSNQLICSHIHVRLLSFAISVSVVDTSKFSLWQVLFVRVDGGKWQLSLLKS